MFSRRQAMKKAATKIAAFVHVGQTPEERTLPCGFFARVGLLTDAFRGYPQRARPAFSPRHYSSSNDPLSQRASPRANKRSAITATKPKACRLRSHVRDLHPIPLFSRTRSACPGLPGSRSCHKSCVLNFRMYQHRQSAGKLLYRPALRRSLSCFACSRLAFFRSALVRLSSWRWASNSFWKRSVFVSAG